MLTLTGCVRTSVHGRLPVLVTYCTYAHLTYCANLFSSVRTLQFGSCFGTSRLLTCQGLLAILRAEQVKTKKILVSKAGTPTNSERTTNA
jgi:hypothetical protein